MERPVRAGFNTQIYEEACEWFIECRAGDLEDSARAGFDRWLRKSPEHQSAYLEIAAIWNEGPTLDPANRWDLDTLVAQAAQYAGNIVALERTSRPTSDTPQPVPSRDSGAVSSVTPNTVGRGRLFAVAASFLLFVAALAVYVLSPEGVYATALGEQRSFALNDGSTVQLNSLSKVRIRYTEHERTVDLLQGQALFHVAKDAARPFIVYSGQTRVRAVGTQFDVYRKTEGTVVTVVEGRVAILGIPERADSATRSTRGESDGSAQRPVESSNAFTSDVNQGHPSALKAERNSVNLGPGTAGEGNPLPDHDVVSIAVPHGEGAIFLAAGEQITVGPKAAVKTLNPNIAGATAWTQRELVFDSAPLTDVAEEFNRYNDRKLFIDASASGYFHVSGVFSSTDPASLIRFLRDRPGLRVIETPTEIRVEQEP